MSIFISILVFASCSSQNKLAGIKDHSFFQVNIPGNVRVDSADTNEVNFADTLTVIFIESKDPAPQWERVWKGRHAYSVRTIEIREWPHSVGIDNTTGEKITISPAKGNKIYFLQLNLLKNPGPVPVEMKAGEVILKGTINNREVIYKITGLTQLAAPRFRGAGRS
ncbi:MAG TPA: hypothetical protein VGC29_10445 [Flavisolibacter sp.]